MFYPYFVNNFSRTSSERDHKGSKYRMSVCSSIRAQAVEISQCDGQQVERNSLICGNVLPEAKMFI